MTFLPGPALLSFDEIVRVASVARSLGVDAVRLTGGEPLVRRGLDRLIGRLSETSGSPTCPSPPTACC